MNDFFTFWTEGDGELIYFNHEMRQVLNSRDDIGPIDALMEYYKKNAYKLNQYLYNPITKKLTMKQMCSGKDDKKIVKSKLKDLDFSKIVPELIIRDIVNPLSIHRSAEGVTPEETKMLDDWIINYSDRNPIFYRSLAQDAWQFIWDNIHKPVCCPTLEAVRISLAKFFFASCKDNVENSIYNAYVIYGFSFFNNTSQSSQQVALEQLFKNGLVPSFDGNVWRLHTGPQAKIVYETPSKK